MAVCEIRRVPHGWYVRDGLHHTDDPTCNLHDLPCRTDATPYWRESYDHVIGEMIAASDPVTHEVLATIWDSVGIFAGGTQRCDGSHEVVLRPLPAWIRENLDG